MQEGEGVHSEFFHCKTGLSLHFTDSKGEYGVGGRGGGVQMTGDGQTLTPGPWTTQMDYP